MLFKLAWRNIWRNKRRTLITMASILFAVLFASVMEALQKGAWDNMIGNVVNFYYGYAQIHEEGYWEDQSIDRSFELADSLVQMVDAVPHIEEALPRLESFALASTGNSTMGVLVVGIDPAAENSMTKLESRLVQGRYLNADEQAVLVGEGVAENLKLEIGDTLILISQGYHGANAAGKYPIKGLVHFASPDLNKQIVYLPLQEAQWFYAADGRVTTLALHIDDLDDIKPALTALRSQLDTSRYEVMDWKELLPDLLQAKRLDSAGNIIVYIILYLVIAFGIFGTILMMVREREYEFGILLAIGMHRGQLARTVWIETVLLGILGAVFGIVASMPLVYYLKVNPIRFTGEYAGTMEKFGFEPIFPALFKPEIFLTQALVVFIITALLAVYPVFKIRRMRPVEAMRA